MAEFCLECFNEEFNKKFTKNDVIYMKIYVRVADR